MNEATAREKFATARSAKLATADRAGVPHIVPIVFALDGNVITFAVDHKPKSTMNLRRLRNIGENDRVCLLVDLYDDDWSRLWWARADGKAEITTDPATRARAITRLSARYDQYRDHPPEGPVVTVTVESWSGWSYGSS
ncbi:PPOX class probable F420-dependent enzyme [Streptosporangium becharense]|uniref:PPOX class probable F420-dependent enzyme n=1 Tax=Streptosporangium becharense TaxID=1816182 RepID=A0A7W9MHI0_9ACTN|nr:TIGR03668 family PPOX class F420-dependent oxidoreductase [Streptosporangium becharense]MBB2912673.1 PPOX class probable F420-dependent enzyme [Streptosporangium becharense]MBB5820498.1 PPOX class probable F420-dependent enzyme [Streptosporangium becharense]